MITNLSNFAALLAAVAAAAAAIFTWMQARSARTTSQSQLFLAFSTRYSDPKIGEALTLLISWYKNNPEEFDEIWWNKFLKNDEQALRLEQARRMISIFFVDIARLYESKQITKRTAYFLLGYYGLEVYYNICQPMWKKLYSEEYTDYAKLLKGVRPSYGKSPAFSPA